MVFQERGIHDENGQRMFVVLVADRTIEYNRNDYFGIKD